MVNSKFCITFAHEKEKRHPKNENNNLKQINVKTKMKKIFIIMFMALTAIVANAQIAVQESKTWDNVSVGIDAGVATPLQFDNVLPVNPTVGIRVSKDFTPVWGAELEGNVWFGSNSAYGIGNRFDDGLHNIVRGLYVGVNGTTNLTNMFLGYKGTPRLFEVKTVLGLGWVRGFRANTPDKYNNSLGAKTGLDLAFNLGENKAHTINIRPAVLWNLSYGSEHSALAFNSKGAQLQLTVGYTYHFKTSNGTHSFKTYNIGAYEAEIEALNAELAKKPTEVEVIRYVDKVVEKKVVERVFVNETCYVLFGFDSAELDDVAKAGLDTIEGTVKIEAYASPEGSEKHNVKLSQQRADVVAEYLRARGVEVVEAVGNGVSGNSSNRVAIVKMVREHGPMGPKPHHHGERR